MKTVILNNGVEMPILGIGVYQIPDLDECEKSVSQALETGYRLIDTAAAYMNETAVGKAIRKSSVARDKIFVTTKLWIQDAGYTRTKKSFERSLTNLGLDYLDLYLIHQPFGDVYGAWRAMEELYRDGRIRAIGISNFASDRLMDLMVHHEVKPTVNQIETHPFCQQVDAYKFLKKHQVQMESWGPFAESKQDIFKNEVFTSIAKNHDKSVAQVILRWLIQRDVVAIPKSVHRERIVENFAVFDFNLSSEDMEAITALDAKQSSFFDHRDPEMVACLGNMTL